MYGQAFQTLPNGANVAVYDGGMPALPFFLVKTRLGSGNEENGDYVVTAFLSGQAPIGIKPFTANAYYITPTIAAGKGLGRFQHPGHRRHALADEQLQ